MQQLNYIITAFVVNLGMTAGIGLAYIAKEEIEDGKRYFTLMKNILFSGIIALVILQFTHWIYSIVSFGLIFCSMFLFRKKKINKYIKIGFTYLLFGIVFFLSSKNMNYFILSSGLIFLYGFPSGALEIEFKKKNKWKIILISSVFFMTAIILNMI